MRGLDSSDRIDEPHLRSAIALAAQIVPVTDSVSTSRLRTQATEHLGKHARDLDTRPVDKRPEEKEKRELVMPDGIELGADNLLSAHLICNIGKIDSSKLTLDTVSLADAPSSVDQLRPKEGDYLNIPVRALSATIVTAHIDFSEGTVLQDSVPLLNGVTVFPNHQKDVNEWLGSVTESSWDASSKPPGIDANLQIDALANPRITRGLLNEPPALNWVSVNLKLDWKKSHPDMEKWTFIKNLGKKVDGEMVRFIATKIHYYGEISLVFFGADKNAKIKN